MQDSNYCTGDVFTRRLSNILPPTAWDGNSEKKEMEKKKKCSFVQPFHSHSFINVSNIRTVVYSPPVAKLRRTKSAVFIGIWAMFPFFFPWSHLFRDESRDPNIWVVAQRNQLQVRYGCEVFFFLQIYVGICWAEFYPQVLERKTHICVLIISSVHSSNSEDQCGSRGGLQWESWLYGRGNAVRVNIPPHLTHTEAPTLAGNDEQLYKYLINDASMRFKKQMNTQKMI